MSKVKLNLEDFEIDTFLTTDEPRGPLAGVFRAHSIYTEVECITDPVCSFNNCTSLDCDTMKELGDCSCANTGCASCAGTNGEQSVCTICED